MWLGRMGGHWYLKIICDCCRHLRVIAGDCLKSAAVEWCVAGEWLTDYVRCSQQWCCRKHNPPSTSPHWYHFSTSIWYWFFWHQSPVLTSFWCQLSAQNWTWHFSPVPATDTSKNPKSESMTHWPVIWLLVLVNWYQLATGARKLSNVSSLLLLIRQE